MSKNAHTNFTKVVDLSGQRQEPSHVSQIERKQGYNRFDPLKCEILHSKAKNQDKYMTNKTLNGNPTDFTQKKNVSHIETFEGMPEMCRENFMQYGNTILKSAFCKKCKTDSFVIDGRLQCCDTQYEKIAGKKTIKIISQARDKRILLSEKDKELILSEQGYSCYWCDIPFNFTAKRKGKIVKRKITYDHVIPFSFGQNNHKYNFVASCHVCNGIKSNLMFDTEDALKIYIADRRRSKGYDF